ncbi:MAG: tail fiber protein [Segetibacter sp.]|nr:tail fiber protein [Segetibacter sp.]
MKKILLVLLLSPLLLSFNLIAQNVGIGTSSPATKLQIKTPNNTDGFSHVSDGGILLTEHVGGVSASIGTTSNHTFRLMANGVAVININPDGKVGLGTTAPGNFKFKISDVSHGLAIENAFTFDNWELYTVGGNAGWLSLFFNGTLKGTFSNSTGAYTQGSDERLKTNIKPMSAMLEKIKQLKPATYQFKNTTDKQEYNGFIAQEVMQVFPSLVMHNVNRERKLDVYTMDYSGFGVIAVKGIQELQSIIEEDKKKMATLEERIIKLEAALAFITEK